MKTKKSLTSKEVEMAKEENSQLPIMIKNIFSAIEVWLLLVASQICPILEINKQQI